MKGMFALQEFVYISQSPNSKGEKPKVINLLFFAKLHVFYKKKVYKETRLHLSKS